MPELLSEKPTIIGVYSESEITSVVQEKRLDIEKCYKDRHTGTLNISGGEVKLVIENKTGQVQKVTISSPTSSSFDKCVYHIFKRLSFPAKNNGVISIVGYSLYKGSTGAGYAPYKKSSSVSKPENRILKYTGNRASVTYYTEDNSCKFSSGGHIYTGSGSNNGSSITCNVDQLRSMTSQPIGSCTFYIEDSQISSMECSLP